MSSRTLTIAACVALASSCGSDHRVPNDLNNPEAFGVSGLRRLSRFELANSVGDVFGVAPDDVASMLPDDLAGTTPFDNDYRAQSVSPLVISNYSAFAHAYA